jgi:hypothetical protein
VKLDEKDYLAHYGILRRSGRYPWGSGRTQHVRNKMYLDTIEDLRRQGMTEAEIAKGFHKPPEYPFTVETLRALKSIALNEQRQHKVNQVVALREKGWSFQAIADRMGLPNESSARSLYDPARREKADILQATANMLRKQVDEKGAIDIGAQVERDLPIGDNPAVGIGISATKFKTAVEILKQEGYETHSVKIPQLTGKGLTERKVLVRPDVQWKDLVKDPTLVKTIQDYTKDGGRTWEGTTDFRPPKSVSSKRIRVNYKEDGGATKDGLIELRPGVKDLDMGRSRYAQVRIAVDDTHFLKGMAVYSRDLPPGVDIRFNTNKSKKEAPTKKDAMKEMEKTPDGKIDMENPFGAIPKRGGQRGALNILSEEGDWAGYRRSLSSQMLSKQEPRLIKEQLDLTHERRRKELDTLLELNNPAVKKELLKAFSEETDKAAVDLHAAPRRKQSTKVLIPDNTVKPTEIYAPTLPDGTRVALVRHPHAGPFEIPELTVNNRNPSARRTIGTDSEDAVAIHHKVAERLSGADFDGDYVLVIPNDHGEVKSKPALAGLKDFDPKSAHPPYDGMRTVDGGRYNAKTRKVEYKTTQVVDGKKVEIEGKPNKVNMQNEMGRISNLITDMSLQGAPNEDLARAVRHSMVIIDSEKHALDYKGSAESNNILQLKKKYQPKIEGEQGGAATLISRAGQETRIPKRKPRPAAEGGPIDKKTGKKVFVETGEQHVDRKTGKLVTTKFKVDKQLSVVDDAHKLVSRLGTPQERLYADHSNRLKAMANEARKAMVNTKPRPISSSAKKTYKKERESLLAKLSVAEKNAPRERQAQAIGNSILNQRKAANPDMSSSQERKIKRRAIEDARARVFAKKQRVDITQDEWNAIQAGAISNNQLEAILRHSDLETIRKYATPKQRLVMTSTKTARAKAMLASGYTQAEVADALGVALSTLKLSLAE